MLAQNRQNLGLAELVGDAFECYNVKDRFLAAGNESEIVQQALMSENGTFFAGLVFLHESHANPKHVQYKIRMAKDMVPTTEDLKQR